MAVVVGYAAEAVEERRAPSSRYGVKLELVYNDKAEVWNNAYSLWCARDHVRRALLVNGDTVHPVAVEGDALAARGPGILLAVDTEKRLAEEEMKIRLDDSGRLVSITKLMDPASAYAEYIGATLIEGSAAPRLADALRATFERDPQLYYEDGYSTSPTTARTWASPHCRPAPRGRGGRPRRPRLSPGDRMPLPSADAGQPLHRDRGGGRRGRPAAPARPLHLDDRQRAGGGRTVDRGRDLAATQPRAPRRDLPRRPRGQPPAATEPRSPWGAGYDAVVAIGGGKTLDVAKYAATRAGIPMIAVATNLAHDGICSRSRPSSTPTARPFGVAMPLSVVVDLDYVRPRPHRWCPADRRRGQQPVRDRGLAARGCAAW